MSPSINEKSALELLCSSTIYLHHMCATGVESFSSAYLRIHLINIRAVQILPSLC